MKYLFIILFLPLICFGQKVPKENDPKLRGCCTNKERTDSLNGKPISYYLNHKNIDKYSKLFYNGEFAMYDTDEFFSLMDSVLTKNNDTRPFYFYIFNRILDISDGCISDVASEYCKKYVEKYPCEFLTNCNNRNYATPKNTWAELIGFTFDNRLQCDNWLRKIDKRIPSSCQQQNQWLKLKPIIRNSINDK